MEDERVVGGIPFPDDLLFHFFQKYNSITDTYILDVKRNIKLYPRKSNSFITTSVNTQLHIAKELVDYTLGFEYSEDVYFDSATWDYSRSNWLCGRGNNTGFPSGMVAPGLNGNGFKCNWKGGSGVSVVSMNSKPASWYRVTMIITATTHQQKVQNLSTGEIFLGTVELNGTSTIGESVAFTLFSYGIDGYTGAYGSIGMNVSNIRITRNGATIFHLPLSEGSDSVVSDVISKTKYTVGFFTPSVGWAKLADYSHYNFKNGFTLYTKSLSPNYYVPNASDGTEITLVAPPTGYTRIANYKGTTTSYNQCESKFKLDNVSAGTQTINFTFKSGHLAVFLENEIFIQTTTQNGRPKYVAQSSASKYIYWSGTAWIIWGNSTSQAQNSSDVETFNLVVYSNWDSYFKTAGSSFTSSFSGASDLYNADPDRFLFTENTGVAKELTIQDIDVDTGFDRGHLYINPNPQEKNLMLYKTDKTLLNDVKIIKYIGIGDEIVTDEGGDVVYDDNDHAILED